MLSASTRGGKWFASHLSGKAMRVVSSLREGRFHSREKGVCYFPKRKTPQPSIVRVRLILNAAAWPQRV